MDKKNWGKDPWEDFEILQAQRPPEEEPVTFLPQEPPPRRRPSSRRGRDKPRPPKKQRKRPPQGRDRPRRPENPRARIFLLLFTLVAMAAVTAFLCVFLLFKVRLIEVTGDQVYDREQIIQITGFQEGDNLALLTTSDKERALERQLPYVADAQITRRFPSTLEIHITAAQQAACVQSGGQWLLVSGEGKLLEAVSEPPEGVMQVTGVTLQEPAVGGFVQSEDEGACQALLTILSVLQDWGVPQGFATLDLSDLYNVTMNYQDRVLFQLGSTVELAYKVDYGLRLVTSTDPVYVSPDETGVLNLTLAGEVKEAYFTAGPLEATPSPSPAGSAPGEETSGEEGGDSGEETGAGEPEPTPTPEPIDRGEGIPTAPFTG